VDKQTPVYQNSFSLCYHSCCLSPFNSRYSHCRRSRVILTNNSTVHAYKGIIDDDVATTMNQMDEGTKLLLHFDFFAYDKPVGAAPLSAFGDIYVDT